MGQAEPLKDLDLVCLLSAFTTEHGEEVAADTFGTVVAVYADGDAYEVDFVHGLATVDADRLTAVPVSEALRRLCRGRWRRFDPRTRTNSRGVTAAPMRLQGDRSRGPASL